MTLGELVRKWFYQPDPDTELIIAPTTSPADARRANSTPESPSPHPSGRQLSPT
jgi:hypothetical protein